MLIVATRSAAEVSEEAAVPEGVLARHGDGAVGVNLGGEAPRHEVHRRPVAEVLADAVHLQLGGRHGALALARRVGEEGLEERRAAVRVPGLDGWMDRRSIHSSIHSRVCVRAQHPRFEGEESATTAITMQ